jgi:hypothetical protein
LELTATSGFGNPSDQLLIVCGQKVEFAAIELGEH